MSGKNNISYLDYIRKREVSNMDDQKLAELKARLIRQKRYNAYYEIMKIDDVLEMIEEIEKGRVKKHEAV